MDSVQIVTGSSHEPLWLDVTSNCIGLRWIKVIASIKVLLRQSLGGCRCMLASGHVWLAAEAIGVRIPLSALQRLLDECTDHS